MLYFCNINRGSSSVGRALASQAKGRGFESRFPLKKKGCLWTTFLYLIDSSNYGLDHEPFTNL